jgi:sodium transport system permease protein
MNWSNVKLIFLREVRDQLRDRRTLFTIAVLPLLLYPLLGMTFLQVSQFAHEQPARVWVVGARELPPSPPLLERQGFHPDVCPSDEARLLELEVSPDIPGQATPDVFAAEARAAIRSGKFAAVVVVPPGFADALARFRSGAGKFVADEAARARQPQVVFDAANDQSRIADGRLERVLNSWRGAIVRQYLADRHLPLDTTDPFQIVSVDVSQELSRRAAFWSKLLPFVLFVWALTGAFYPAVDLCAGEKERGTLETLLSSPAERSEIVMGKLLTIMGFSAATSLLNLLSMAITGTAVIKLQPAAFPMGVPPVSSFGWLLLALVPVSALFSALALAIAAFARSTKEGQYYLMPLLLITLPLMILSLLPAVSLNLGTSLVPITGMMMLLRSVVEGQYAEAALFAPPVLLVTGGCCLLAIRWAVGQFNNEAVLFRESERVDIGLWLRHLVRDRAPTPTVGEAIACGLILLTIRFFATFAATLPATWAAFAWLQFTQLAVLVALPVIALAATFTRSLRATLLLKPAGPQTLGLAALLAVTLHPLALWLTEAVQRLYPINERMLTQLESVQQLLAGAPVWQVLALMALTPAICEELAFRGFILSGLRHMGSTWGAIVVSSLLFGVTHGILQQSISAAVVGVVLAYLAVKTGSLLPGIVFHVVHNTLGLSVLLTAGAAIDREAWWLKAGSVALSYRWTMIVVGTLLSLVILRWFRRLPHDLTPEERLHEAMTGPAAHASVP